MQILLELFRAMVCQGCMRFLFNSYCQRGSPPIFYCSNKNSTNPQKWAFLIPFNTISISPGTKQENAQYNNHQNTRDSKSQTPTKVFLYIAQDQNCYSTTPTYTKIPPVEEWAFGFALLRIQSIKLISSKSLNTRLVSALTNCN